MMTDTTVLVSRLSIRECRRRLEEEVEVDVPGASDMKLRYGILALLQDDGFRLRVRRALIYNVLSPRLWARFSATPAATLIEVRFRVHPLAIVWASCAAAFVTLLLVLSLWVLLIHREPDALTMVIITLMMVALMALGVFFARRDRAHLLRFVQQTLVAAPAESTGGLTSRLSGPA